MWAFNRTQMEAGDPNAQGVTFNLPRTIGGATVFSLLPEQRPRGHGGPAGRRPELLRLDLGPLRDPGLEVRGQLGEPVELDVQRPDEQAITPVDTGPNEVPEKDGNDLDTLSWRLMMQNQYTNQTAASRSGSRTRSGAAARRTWRGSAGTSCR